MCGLLHVKRFDKLPAAKLIKRRFEAQKERGTQGFGFVSLTDGVVKNFLKADEEEAIMGSLDKDWGDEILFHHRKPTSTANYWEVAHPIEVNPKGSGKTFYVVHNGMIENTDDLKKKHDTEGYKYNTLLMQYDLTTKNTVYKTGEKWNDSESFAIELSKALVRGDIGISHVRGTIAFIALEVEGKKAKKLYWGRNSARDLTFLKTESLFIISSEGKGSEEVKCHTLCSYDYDTGAIESKPFSVGTTVYPVNSLPSPYVPPYQRYNDHEIVIPKLLSAKNQTVKDIEDELLLDDWMDSNKAIAVIKDKLKDESLTDKIKESLTTERIKHESIMAHVQHKFGWDESNGNPSNNGSKPN